MSTPRRVLSSSAIALASLLAAGCGTGERSSLQWSAAAYSDGSRPILRLWYATGESASGDRHLAAPSKATIRVSKGRTYVELHSADVPDEGAVAAVKYVRCTSVPLPTRIPLADLRDGTEPLRRPEIAASSDRTRAPCPEIPKVTVDD
jgi:hypothetical protein